MDRMKPEAQRENWDWGKRSADTNSATNPWKISSILCIWLQLDPLCLWYLFFFPLCNIPPRSVSTVWLPRSAKLKTWFLYLEEKYSGVLVMGNKRAFNALWAFIRNLFVEHIWFICYYFLFLASLLAKQCH